jgi:hypothetical protein
VTDRNRTGCTPMMRQNNAALAVDAFQITQQEHAKGHSGEAE